MSNRRLSILFLLASLAIISYVQAIDESHKCTHGQQDNPQPEFMEIEEDFNPGNNEGRRLSSYNNIRMYGYYGLLDTTTDSATASYISNELIPPVLSYYSAALKVVFPVSGLWKTTSSKVCGAATPAALKTGVAADFVYVVTAAATSDYVANTYTCSLASGSARPLSGQTTISTNYVKPTTDVLAHEKNMICMIHELTHALGFSTSMYPHFINATTGKTLTGHVLHETLDGATATVINVAPLTTRLQNFYGCSTLKGAYMENSGSSATAGSHFERKIFTYEMMTSGLVFQQQISQFTLALLEGSGWYVPDYSYADNFSFGQGQGCNFMFQTCPSTQFSEYCAGSSRQCTVVGRGGGTCSSDTRADNCKWVIANEGYDCDNSNYKSYARLPTVETYGRGQNAKCFEGTLTTAKTVPAASSYCFKFTCNAGSTLMGLLGTKTTLTVTVGKTSVLCKAAGPIAVTGYTGTITCPDPLTFCNTVGAAVCPRNCMGRGTCVKGTCQCNTGFTGTDCALNA